MKINELKVIEEGFFSDLGDVITPDRYAERDPKKTQAGVQKLFLKDFTGDFYKDLNDNIKAGVIDTKVKEPEVKPQADPAKMPGSEYAPQGQQRTEFDPNMQPNLNEYVIFNSVIESIINENERQQTPMNIWIVKWFNAYMQGVEWKQELPTVKKIAQDIAKSYDKDKKSAQAQIENLATTAWEITTKNKGSPRGFGNISSASTNQKNNITNREISKDPFKTQDFVNNLTSDEREIIKKALDKAK